MNLSNNITIKKGLWVSGLAIYFLILIVFSMILLIDLINQGMAAEGKNGTIFELHFLYPKPLATIDVNMLFILISVFGGSLGGVIHGLVKLAHETREGHIDINYTLWFIVRPFLGASVSLALFLVFRGGLVKEITVDLLNPTGIGAISILVGLSTNTVLKKLKAVLEAIFPVEDESDNKKVNKPT